MTTPVGGGRGVLPLYDRTSDEVDLGEIIKDRHSTQTALVPVSSPILNGEVTCEVHPIVEDPPSTLPSSVVRYKRKCRGRCTLPMDFLTRSRLLGDGRSVPRQRSPGGRGYPYARGPRSRP